MHAQTRRGVHLDNAAVLFFQGFEHRFNHHVHTAHIQPDHLRGHHRTCGHLGVHIVGHVGGRAAGGQIGVVAQHDTRPFGRHTVSIQALLFQAGKSDVIKADFGEGRGMAIATTRVGVDLVHQLAHG